MSAATACCRLGLVLVAACALLLSGCASFHLADYDNLCKMLNKRPNWKIALKNVEKRWRADPALVMAFIHQESRFDADARSDDSLSRKKARRSEAAYGYAQAKLSTWEMYREVSGNANASRENFFDAVYFIGWYNWQSHIELNIGLRKVKELYFAYHEGRSGYESGSHLETGKSWLQGVAEKVEDRYRLYRPQYRSGCRNKAKAGRSVAPGK